MLCFWHGASLPAHGWSLHYNVHHYKGGGGGASSGDNFGGENFDTPPIVLQGHQTREISTTPTLGSLWTIGCVKFWPVKLTLYPLGPPPDELLKK